MPFIDQWKTAKNTFEATVKDSKPAPKLLERVRQGTGIQAALKEIDKSTQKGQAVKAIATFDKACVEYCTLLASEINKPTSVKYVDKAIYIKALEKLKKHLERVKLEAQKMAEGLEGQHKKAVIDSKLLQAAQQHVGLQTNALQSFTKVGQEFVAHEAQLKRYFEGAKAALAKYKNPALIAAARTNSETVQRFFEESEKLRWETAKKRMDEVLKKHEPACKTLDAVDAVKARLKEIPAKTIAEAKQRAENLAKLKLGIETRYQNMRTLCDQMRTFAEEARPIDAEALDGAKEHLALRNRMIVEVTGWSKESNLQWKKLQLAHVRIRQCEIKAQSAQRLGKKSALEDVEREAASILADATKLVNASKALLAERTKAGSDLLLARADNKEDWDKLPPSIGNVIRKQAGTAFAKLDLMQREWQAPLGKMDLPLMQMESALEQIEALNGKTKPASYYLGWLNPAAAQCAKDVLEAKSRLSKVDGYFNTYFPKFRGVVLSEKDKEMPRTQHKFFKQTWEKMNQVVAEHENLSSRLDGVPSKEKEVTNVIEKIRNDIALVTTINNAYQTKAAEADEEFTRLFG